ncbi:3D domain-containing protein [Halodesulfovibrio marinisediminis]|uniref:3D (Asp-Asp-Asp) domain-containing protein n=1 Tax=Halodesulfovibrio marinisediminis DSM 17456 TaxID=1121457 RepID=A0A1N6DT07_9BACT|nr:3D domain-containing protein [Halodesulfovibrio marinisediminis]SIN73932.1 3D (Asp-Asp-Asp) domain-containing protein [Halodesulfovibrio marinisediminis DSM 17456]
MKNGIYLLLFLAAGAFFIQHQREIQQLRQLIDSQNQELHAMQVVLRNNSVQSELALEIGRRTQQSLHDSRAKRVVKVTAYSPRSIETDSTPFITASNTKVRPGIIAVSRDLFAKGWTFGKKVYIKSLGVFTIEDLMAKRKKNQIDVFMPETTQALSFGRRNLEAYLLNSPPISDKTYTQLYPTPHKDFLLASEDLCRRTN